MTHTDVHKELLVAAAEPLSPVEKKLIGWSFGTGLALLVVLMTINHYFPAHF